MTVENANEAVRFFGAEWPGITFHLPPGIDPGEPHADQNVVTHRGGASAGLQLNL